jgi:hypothetical protein
MSESVRFNIKNVKYAKQGGGSIKTIGYATGFTKSADFQTLPIYGDGDKLIELASDKGLTGTLSLRTLADTFEEDNDRALSLENNSGEILQEDVNVFDLYLETEATYVDGANKGQTYIRKYWYFGVTFGKPTQDLSQTEDNININEWNVELNITGKTVLDAAGTASYVDASGRTRKAISMVAVPTDTNYTTFGASVPVVKVATPPAPPEE